MTSVQLPFLLQSDLIQNSHGVVYTKPWVVDLILDLAGYIEEKDLTTCVAVEPSVGDGVFVVAMVRRLIKSCARHGRDVWQCQDALFGIDLDPRSVNMSRRAVARALIEEGIESDDASSLAEHWIRQGNYLFEAPTLPLADFVIGNPPYIRLEDIGSEIAATYREMYRTMKGRADIYIAFFEAALRHLASGGICAFICADRWMLNQYGGALRSFITDAYAVETIIEMHDAIAFESDVSAYPAITVIRRGQQGPVVVARADERVSEVGASKLSDAIESTRTSNTKRSNLPGFSVARIESWFSGSDPWPCTSPERLALLRRLENEFEPLESSETGTKVSIGVATGADNIFITTDPNLVELERLLPLAIGPDTLSGTLEWSGHYLVNPWNEHGLVDLARYPRLAAYFEANRDRLTMRHVAKRRAAHWYRTIDRVTHSLTNKPKLYIPDIKYRIHPVLDVGKTYPHHNLYVIYSQWWDLEVLGGLLLSDVGQFFVECYGVRMRGGWLRFQAQYLRRIRVPKPEDLTVKQSAGLADAFRRRDGAAATRLALDVYRIDELPMGDKEARADHS